MYIFIYQQLKVCSQRVNWTQALYSSGTVHSAQTGTLPLEYTCTELCFSSIHVLRTDLNLWLELISVYYYCYYFTRASAVGLSSCYCSLSAHTFHLVVYLWWKLCICDRHLFASLFYSSVHTKKQKHTFTRIDLWPQTFTTGKCWQSR